MTALLFDYATIVTLALLCAYLDGGIGVAWEEAG